MAGYALRRSRHPERAEYFAAAREYAGPGEYFARPFRIAELNPLWSGTRRSIRSRHSVASHLNALAFWRVYWIFFLADLPAYWRNTQT